MWTALTIVHAVATWFLVGLIWTVQVVHYPSFRHVESTGYAAFQADHMRRMGWLVGPPWLVEGVTVLAVFVAAPGSGERLLATVGGVAELVVIWATIRLAVPEHERLAAGRDDAAIERLVRTNWVRTIAWSGRGLIAALLLL